MSINCYYAEFIKAMDLSMDLELATIQEDGSLSRAEFIRTMQANNVLSIHIEGLQ